MTCLIVCRILAEGEFTEAEYNKLKRKIDWTLLPLVSAFYSTLLHFGLGPTRGNMSSVRREFADEDL